MSLALTSANASILLAVSLSGPKLKLTSLEDAMADWQWWLLGPLRPRTESARRKRGSPRFLTQSSAASGRSVSVARDSAVFEEKGRPHSVEWTD